MKSGNLFSVIGMALVSLTAMAVALRR